MRLCSVSAYSARRCTSLAIISGFSSAFPTACHTRGSSARAVHGADIGFIPEQEKNRRGLPGPRTQFAGCATGTAIALRGNPFPGKLLRNGMYGESALHIHLKDTLHQLGFLLIDDVLRTSGAKLLIGIPERNIAAWN